MGVTSHHFSKMPRPGHELPSPHHHTGNKLTPATFCEKSKKSDGFVTKISQKVGPVAMITGLRPAR
jgi:hypothetical protein